MSKIEWTDETWNPVRGCSRVSEGCRNCYAEAMAARFCGPGQPYEGLATRSPARWTGTIYLVGEKLDEPLRWRKPRRVFVNSMSDLFHDGLGNEEIAAIFGIMAAADAAGHVFQVLTKRPKRMRDWFRWVNRAVHAESSPRVACLVEAEAWLGRTLSESLEWPLPNVWLGVSVENQDTANERIPILLDTPAAVRWVSYEPALGPVDLDPWLATHAVPYPPPTRGSRLVDGLDWVVVGGESGPNARPCDLEWLRATVNACRDAAVPVFVKQAGAFSYQGDGGGSGVYAARRRSKLAHPKGGDPDEWPEDLRVREWPNRDPQDGART